MYYHKDYLIKLIQQFIVFLSTLLKIKSTEDSEYVLIQIERAYSHFLGYPKELLLKLNFNSLKELFRFHEEFLFERLGILGILLLEEADIYKKNKFIEEYEIFRNKGLEILENVKNHIKDPEFKKIILKNLNEYKK